MSSMRKRVRDRNVSRRERQLSKTSLGDLWHVVEGSTWPLTLLDHVLPECLGTKQVEACACDLELHRGKKKINAHFWLQ